ncbi:DNA polymerase IV [Actinomyces bovis]|uniref:DNA polymerase IV n=1 Tax=Actinomyces bovis TaxID=1658 RepID=A0ABY1VJZ6_9ACTO|nr:DNA polymerase Y family protein [Actinomyces bovis]SPT52425.1 DNA polymerase IV [Actinomyces bovis]VEG54060.1 DNA polymerase IV [Actinomyces israelii]
MSSAAAAAPTSRLLALWVPDWPVVSLATPSLQTSAGGVGAKNLNPAVQAVAVLGGAGVVAASAPARAAGVTAGMRLRLARSLCPELVVLPPQPEREARAFEPVLEALEELVADPIVARPGLALAGARGPARWAGGEAQLAARITEIVTERTGVEGQVGVAESLLGAVLAARRGVLVPAGEVADFLAPWPMSSLLAALTTRRVRQEAKTLIETFSRLGLRLLGDLAVLPGRDVAARFGPIGLLLHSLASGKEVRSSSQRRPDSDLQVDCELDPPVERSDRAAFAARSLAESLCELLLKRGLAARRLQVQAVCENGAERSRSWVLEGMPTPSDVTDRVRWQLEGWLAGGGEGPASALVHLRLVALDLYPAGAEQRGLWSRSGAHGRQRASRAVERVESLLGVGSVLRPVVVEGWDPRGRVHLLPWGEELMGAQPPSKVTQLPQSWRGALPAPSPAVVLSVPAPAHFVDAAGRDLGVDAHGRLDGIPKVLRIKAGPYAGEQEVSLWAGPWPVAEAWWRPSGGRRRAYLQVVTRSGESLLLVRAGRWWLEGCYN